MLRAVSTSDQTHPRYIAEKLLTILFALVLEGVAEVCMQGSEGARFFASRFLVGAGRVCYSQTPLVCVAGDTFGKRGLNPLMT